MSGPVTSERRVLLIADADSYVKWGVALLDRAPASWKERIVLARNTELPTERQVSEAIHGTRFDGHKPEVVGRRELERLIAEWQPHMVLTAGRGPMVRALISIIGVLPDRPVIVCGLPGISVPVLRRGLPLRKGSDLFILHSKCEVREFSEASAYWEIPLTFSLASLPFLRELSPDNSHTRDRIVFAAQALVPEGRAARERLLAALVDTANAHPETSVVVKVRARAGEQQTHDEDLPFEQLIDERRAASGDIPPNLLVEGGSMQSQLERAVGFVTVSSTAILEAIAQGVPSLALDDFGVSAELINQVFVGSGLLAHSSALVAGEFRKPDPGWLDDNYFHDPADNTWMADIERLIEQRESQPLPQVLQGRTLSQWLRNAYMRDTALQEANPSFAMRLISGTLRTLRGANRLRWRIVRLVRPGPAQSRPLSHAPTQPPSAR